MAVNLDHLPIITVSGRKSSQLPANRKNRNWYVACIKSNQDRAFANELTIHGVTRFIALTPTQVRSGGNSYDAQKPVFPGYVFFHGTSDARFIALETKRTYHIIPPEEIYQDRLQFQLKQVFKVLSSPSVDDVQVQAGRILGKRCLITNGYLQGTECTALDIQSGEVVVQVEVLGQGIRLKVSPFHLSPIT